MRDRWLNADGMSETDRKKRTLTNLYNTSPTWLDLAHKKLDAAVFAAYGWPADLISGSAFWRPHKIMLGIDGELTLLMLKLQTLPEAKMSFKGII